MDADVRKIVDLLMGAVESDASGATLDDPPMVDAEDVHETSDGFTMRVGGTEYRVKVERE